MKKRKILITTFIILAALLGGYFVLDYYNQNDNNNGATVNVDEDSTILPDIKQPDNNQDETDNSTDNDNQKSDSTSDPNPNRDETDSVQDSTPLSVPGITYAGSQSGGYVVEALVSTSKDGECQLLLTGPKTVNRTNPTVQQPSYRQCKNFNFEDGELPSGDWTAKVRFKYNGEFSEYSDPYEFTVQ